MLITLILQTVGRFKDLWLLISHWLMVGQSNCASQQLWTSHDLNWPIGGLVTCANTVHGLTMRCRPMGAFASSHMILKMAQDAQTTSIFNRKVNNGRFLSCCYSLTLSYEYVSRFKLTMGVVDDFFIFQPISCTMLRVILFVSYAARASSDDDIFEDCHSGPWRLETLYRATWSREEKSPRRGRASFKPLS